MITFVLGRAGSGKSRYCIDRFNEYVTNSVHNDTYSPSYIIVPEQYTMMTERSILLSRGTDTGRALMGHEVLNFKRFAYRILSRYGGFANSVLDSSGRIMLLRKVIIDLSSELTYFTDTGSAFSVKEVPGILKIIEEFSKYNVLSDTLLSVLEDDTISNSFKAKLTDIALIYKEYRKRLNISYIDDCEVMKRACSIISDHGILKGSSVLLDEFSGFTLNELDMLRILFIECDNITISLCVDTECDPLFFSVIKTFSRLKDIAKECHRTYTIVNMPSPSYRFKNSPCLSDIEERYGSLPVKQSDKELSGIEISEHDTPFSEINYCIQNIIRLHDEQNIAYSDIALAVKNTQYYEQYIRSLFDQYHIPFFFDSGKSITGNPLIRTVISLLNIVISGYSQQDVIEFLKCGFYYTSSKNVDILENYILSKGLTGRNMFIRDNNPFVTTLIDDIRYFTELLGKCKNLGDCCIALCEFMIRLKLKEKTDIKAKLLKAKGDDYMYNEYIRIWNISIGVIEQINDFMGDTGVSSAFECAQTMKALLECGFSQYNIKFLPQSDDAVSVITVGRSRCSDISVLFMVGVNEGVYPSSIDDNGLLKDAERDYLDKHNIELADDCLTRAYKDRFLTYKVLTAASKELYISYSLEDGSGDKMLPSTVIRDIQSIFPGLSIKYQIKHLTIPIIEKPVSESDVAFYTGTEFSVSKIEKFIQCPYMFFMNYGIGLKPRNIAEINIADMGTLMHLLIDKASLELGRGNMTKTDALEIITDLSKQILNDSRMYAFNINARNITLTKRIIEYTANAFYTIYKQIYAGDFRPISFETSFGFGEILPAISIPVESSFCDHVNIVGIIDRFDAALYTDESGNKGVYIRVVDYKSSAKSISKADVYKGIKLQLLSYMNALKDDSVKRLVSGVYPNDSISVIRPAGVFYFVFDSDISSLKEHPEYDKEYVKPLTMNGFITNDDNIVKATVGDLSVSVIPGKTNKNGDFTVNEGTLTSEDEFTELLKSVNSTLSTTASRILKGEIKACPNVTRDMDPCEYCDYKKVCAVKYK